jgi:hypothetical protein
VKHLAGRGRPGPAAPAVDGVAHDRQSGMGEVEADLVLPSRLQLDLQERPRREALDDPPARARLVRGLARAGQAPAAALVGVVDGRVDGPRFGRGGALDQGGVAPLDPVRAEQVAEPGPGGRGEREGQRPRGVAVQPVHDAHVRPARPPAGGVLLHAGERGVLVVGVGRGRDGEQPRRLVHHHDLFVLVEEGDGGAHARARLAVGVPGDGGAGRDQLSRLQHRLALERDLALLDHVAGAPPGELGVERDEREVQAEAHRAQSSPRASSQAAGSCPK